MENPNPINENAYLDAARALQQSLPALLDAMWQAGATLDNIEDELTTAIGNCAHFPPSVLASVQL